ncbi:Dynein light chain [Cadophora gregata]|uniref:Dynein light chain n=1 Tax=Cadophora gregata TaxID=51156 RepID=UPI0026DB3E2E|nr:Dynein light chain [Cadophora gregata]KAK0118048.1 Dynein light chain [Cadophora gregata]KAK0123117.1 Dynein light chain [Cadophora gregata f. sp. sojae]
MKEVDDAQLSRRRDDLHIVLHSRGTSTITPGRGHLRRVSATTELSSISSYPHAVAFNRYHSYITRDQASQFSLTPQPINPPGERQVNKSVNMSTTEKAKDKLEAQIKSADMTDDMQQEAIDVAQEAMNKFTVEKDIAMHIKKTFDERKGPTWHCIVGRNFGSFVTHETKHFIYFYLGHCAILLFKTQ